ncbi:Mth938-like domain-containing protein [Gammaproteobacteria bacterium AH-315-K14]|nr:Mth938-like domain-containing protein [Gammaproteobacteria bacterium AH-315-K14]
MQVNLDSDIHSYAIRAYEPGAISVMIPFSPENAVQPGSGGQTPRPLEVESIKGSFILSPKHLLRGWPPTDVNSLKEEHLDAIIELQPELILLGTGPTLTFPDPKIMMRIHKQRIGVEVMDTAAACRTFNILMAEGRIVVAGLMNPAKETPTPHTL